MKLAINTMIHGINQTFAEAITLAQGAEITPDYAFNVIEASAACAPMLTYRRPLYMDKTPYDVTFTVTLAEKDMCIATDLARSSGVATPQGDVTLSVLSKAKNDGFGHRDIAAILNYMRKGNSRKRQHYLPVAGTAMTPALADWCAYLLLSEGFVVDVYATLSPLADPFNLAGVDLIVPIWSSARSSHKIEFENMTKSEEDRLLKLIAARCGIGGWHRHMGDAFRDRPTYHFMIGGQFVAHPPGWPDNAVPSDDFIDYDVTITAPTHEVVAGIDSFRMLSE